MGFARNNETCRSEALFVCNACETGVTDRVTVTCWSARAYHGCMRSRDIYAMQQRARLQRLLEKQLAAQLGEKPPKVGWFRRWVLGVRN